MKYSKSCSDIARAGLDRRLVKYQKNVFLTLTIYLISLVSQDDHIKIEELHKRRNHLAVFCKLVVYNVFPAKTAAEVTFMMEHR